MTNDPRIEFVTEILDEILGMMRNDQKQRPVHYIRISIDMEEGADEIHLGWGRAFPRTVQHKNP